MRQHLCNQGPEGRPFAWATIWAALALAAGFLTPAWGAVGSFRGGSSSAESSTESAAEPENQSSEEVLSDETPAPTSAPARIASKSTKQAASDGPRVQTFTRAASVTPTPSPSVPDVPERPLNTGAQDELNDTEANAAETHSQLVRLVPGSGFAGPTMEPQRIGDLGLPGADAKAIAHWNVVPEQMILGEFQVGVVAFHVNGIDRIEFSLNGGPWAAVREKRENKITKTFEYFARLSTSEHTDGPFEIRAIAYPTIGQPRLLESLTLIANRGGSVPQGTYFVSVTGDDENGDGTKQRPFATIWRAAFALDLEQGAPYYAANSTVLLMPGDHLYAGRPTGVPRLRTEMGWITIAAAPGVSRERVRIVANSSSSGGLYASRVRFRNLTIMSTALKTDRTNDPIAWFDRCTLEGTGPTDLIRFAQRTQWTGGAYFTDCVIKNLANGPSETTMVRGCLLENLGSDGLQNPRLVINTEINNIKVPPGANYHPDLFQFHGDFDNVIIYGVIARNIHAQGIFSRGLGEPGQPNGIPDRNMAFVNVAIDQRSHFSQWIQSSDHVLFWNVTLLGRAFLLRNDPTGIENVQTNLSVRDSVFQELRVSGGVDPSLHSTVFQNNHFIEGARIGSNATSGAPGFSAPTAQDGFAPTDNSPLLNRVVKPLSPTDANGDMRPHPSAIGAIERLN